MTVIQALIRCRNRGIAPDVGRSSERSSSEGHTRIVWLLAVLGLLVVMLPALGWAPEAYAASEVRIERPMPATANTPDGPRARNSPMLAVDPTEARFVALTNRVDANDFGCGLQVSGDGGRGYVTANPVPELPDGAEKCYAPEVAFDGEGRLYFLFVGLSGAGNSPMGVFLATSDDRARSFSAPRQVLGPDSFQVRMVIDDSRSSRGRLHLVWLQPGSKPGVAALPPTPNPIVGAYSDDGGTTFSPPVIVSDADRQRVVAPAVAVGPEGTLQVLYYDLEDDARDYQGLVGPVWDGSWSLVLATSRDGGQTFAPGTVIDDEVVPPGRVLLIFTMPPPALAVGPSDQVHVAWPDARHGDPDVLVRSSLDGGRSWGAVVRANDDPKGNGRTQTLPQLSVSPGGRLDVVFYDRRHDPDDVENHVFFASSPDEGRNFEPNIQLTSAPSDSRIGRVYDHPGAAGLVEFGSRLGLHAGDDITHAAWTDTHNANRRAFQEVFVAAVTLPTSGSALPSVGLVAGLAALGGGALVMLGRGRRRSAGKSP